MATNPKVRIDSFPESVFRYIDRRAIVCIDVICSGTTAVTAAARGHSVFPAADFSEARRLSSEVANPVLVGEPMGAFAHLFELKNSPAAISRLPHRRPLVVLDLPGTRLIADCNGGRDVYVACLRNLSATAETLAFTGNDVVLIGAGVGGDFRCEDRIAAARIARDLLARGYVVEDPATLEVIGRWADAEVSLVSCGRSANRLRRFGQADDLDFVLAHVDDLNFVCRYENGEIAEAGSPPSPAPAFGTVLQYDRP